MPSPSRRLSRATWTCIGGLLRRLTRTANARSECGLLLRRCTDEWSVAPRSVAPRSVAPRSVAPTVASTSGLLHRVLLHRLLYRRVVPQAVAPTVAPTSGLRHRLRADETDGCCAIDARTVDDGPTHLRYNKLWTLDRCTYDITSCGRWIDASLAL
jgi:hypothetical protein